MGIYIIYTRQGCSLTSLSQAQRCSRHVNTIKLSHNNNCLSGMCVGGQPGLLLSTNTDISIQIFPPNDFPFTSGTCKQGELFLRVINVILLYYHYYYYNTTEYNYLLYLFSKANFHLPAQAHKQLVHL